MRLPLRKSQLRQFCLLLSMLTFMLCIWAGSTVHKPLFAQAQSSQTRSSQARSSQTRSSQAQATPSENADILAETGVSQYQAGNYQGAIASWQQALKDTDADNLVHQSILLENLARAHRQIGHFSEEIDYWSQAIDRHQQRGDLQALGRARTEQSQAYSRLGQHRRAIALLCGESIDTCASDSALHLARALSDTSGEAAALASLGEAYRLTGSYEEAITLLNQSLSIVEDDLNNPAYKATVLNSLGNTHSALAQVSTRRADSAAKLGDLRDQQALLSKANEDNQAAIAFLQHSANIAQSNNIVSAQVRSQLNLIPLYQRVGQADTATQTWQATRQLLAPLPNSQSKAFNTLTLAGYLEPDGQSRQCPADSIVQQQSQLLEEAIAIAQSIQSPRAESFALGQLGNLYERCNNYNKALELTQAARLAADQDRSARDSLYLWAWQQGRILNDQQQPAAAATAYTQAIDVLESIRSDLLAANQDLQFDFRDQVEPIYREFATLKLADVPPSVTIETTAQPSVDTVLVTLDGLKLAELQNYFANDCVITPTATRVDAVEAQSTTAVISTALLSDRLAVIASFPDGQRQVEWLDIDEQTLTDTVNAYRVSLESGRFQRTAFTPTTDLYDVLVRPFKETLAAGSIDTLVFIHDGILRSLPMAALYDGQQYLIEKYAIATTPTLTLTDPGSLDRQNLSALILGLSEASQVADTAYPPLNKVEEEILEVSAQISNSKVLKNNDFSEANMKQALQNNSYQILHIATHGSFGAEPEDNFIVTGQKIDNQKNKALTIGELDALIRSVSAVDKPPIDLLTLTACETSIGDDRATLGLAGIAVRAGVKSAIASLWSVDDSATAELITGFYRYLSDPALSKAQALQAAQREVIEAGGIQQHPYYWAAFTLIGNWL